MTLSDLLDLDHAASDNLPDLLKDHWTIVYFYPKDNTPGCTTQANDFTELLPEFEKLNAKVIGVSRDSLTSHQKFIDKYNLQHILLSDPQEKACNAFNVIKEKNMYGKKVMGIERSTFLFNPQGELIKEWRKVKAAGHANEVLTTLKNIESETN